jgi:hypothetical protein
VAGAVLFDVILRRLGAAEFTLCDLALREGLILDFIHRNSARIRKVERYPDVRRRSVIELAERCGYWPEHAQQVARLALAIFDQTLRVHGLSAPEREWLEYGALLHDVGVHIGYERHHAHSYYLIKNGGLRGFQPQEVEIIALVARYHRRATPKRTHEGYGGLPRAARRTVRTLSAMVRLAEGLDRSHAQVVAGLDLHAGDTGYLARLHVSDNAELEVWAAHRHVAPLEEILGRPLRFELALTAARARATKATKDGGPRSSRRTGGHEGHEGHEGRGSALSSRRDSAVRKRAGGLHQLATAPPQPRKMNEGRRGWAAGASSAPDRGAGPGDPTIGVTAHADVQTDPLPDDRFSDGRPHGRSARVLR